MNIYLYELKDEGDYSVNNSRIVRTQLTISCDVEIDDLIKKNISDQYSNTEDDEEVARQLLFAFLNPKIPYDTELESIEGSWDGICDFNGRFKNIQLD